MIKTTEFDGLYYIVEDGGGVANVSKPVFEAIKKQNDELSKFKSLVKPAHKNTLLQIDTVRSWLGNIGNSTTIFYYVI